VYLIEDICLDSVKNTLESESLNPSFHIKSAMLDQDEELRLAEKRAKGYLFSIFLFLGIATFAFISTRINTLDAYTSYLNGATIIFGGTGLVDIGFYLFARREYLKQKNRSKISSRDSS
jgi:hypothetical protein